MGEFVEQLGSASWWVGVVLVSIIVNIISPYIRRWLESLLGNVSSSMKHRRQERAEKRQKLIETLKSDEYKLILYALQEQRLRIGSFESIALAAILFLIAGGSLLFFRDFASPLTAWVVTAAILLGALVLLFIAMDESRLAREIKLNLTEIKPDIFTD